MGWEKGVLITTFPGEQTFASLTEVYSFTQDG
jgi:hypothetical protein